MALKHDVADVIVADVIYRGFSLEHIYRLNNGDHAAVCDGCGFRAWVSGISAFCPACTHRYSMRFVVDDLEAILLEFERTSFSATFVVEEET